MKTEVLHIRCTAEVKEKATRLAELENRSLTNYIVTLIEREYENFLGGKKND